MQIHGSANAGVFTSFVLQRIPAFDEVISDSLHLKLSQDIEKRK